MLNKLDTPVLLRGNDRVAYRDPAVLYHKGIFYMFYSFVETEDNGSIFWYTAMSTSQDLQKWSQPRKITPRDQNLNYSSPGNIICFNGEWVLCLQTYPIPGLKRSDELRYGNKDARIFIMRSKDLENWSDPELLYVKGVEVSREEMGRMIDPFLVEDIHEPGRWWCFYKQRGASYSWSYDLRNWSYKGRVDAGENVCVLAEEKEYTMIHSPKNGMGIKRSADLVNWRDWGKIITLGQDNWPWAQTRLTAGFILDMRKHPEIGRYLMFFHGAGPGKQKTPDNFYANCSIGIAWSEDLLKWVWPEKGKNRL